MTRARLPFALVWAAAVCPLVPAADPPKPTLFLVSDSTVKTGTKGQQGWSDPLSGRSSNKLVLAKYAEVKLDEVKEKFFTPADNTHTSPAGAKLNATCVADGIRGLKDCALKGFLLPDGK